MLDKIDIGNVRGIQGEKGEKGERGSTPSYDDLRYKKKNDQFVTIVTNSRIHPIEYYIDANNKLCNSEGYLYDDEGNITDELGEPFDRDIYGYEYQQLWEDEDGRITNSNSELLDEDYKVQYVKSEFIGDVANYIFQDEEGYNELVNDVYPNIINTLTSSENFSKYKDFFDALEGDIKYYVCVDNPKTTITESNGTVNNECKYKDEDGNIVVDNDNNPVYVPLEKNALYLYNSRNATDNDIMHYDIYVCLKSNTVPKKLVSSNDFTINYNVIDDLSVTLSDENDDGENEVWLNIDTRGTRGQFYSISDVDTLFANNLINKLGAVNGIAQLNNGGKVPSSQLPAYIDDVVEGTMNSAETVFTPSDEVYIDSVKQKGKIYVDTSSRKTYRWTGSSYIFISNPVVVDDGSTEAFASVSGQALETKMGDATLTTTAKTVTGAINEHESDITSLNTNKQDKSNLVTSWNSTLADTKYPSEKLTKNSLDNKVDKITGMGLSQESFTTTEKTKLSNIQEEANKTIVDSTVDSDSTNPVQNKIIKNYVDSAIDDISDIIDGLSSESFLVYSDEEIVQTGDTVTLTARSYGDDLINKDVSFYKVVDSGTDVLLNSTPVSTGNNGVASYNYTAVGAGETEFYAKIGTSQSETYSVWDTIFAIDGTSDTNNWQVSANVDVAYSDEGTHFTTNGTGGNQISLLVNNSTHYFDGTTDKVYEFDFKIATSMALYLIDNNGVRRLVYAYITYNMWQHFKWLYDASNKTVTVYVDGVAETPVDLSDYNLTTIGLQFYDWQSDANIWIKNLKIYNG